MLVRRLWHKLTILTASNVPAVRSRTSLITSLKGGIENTSANVLISPQGRSRAKLELEQPPLTTCPAYIPTVRGIAVIIIIIIIIMHVRSTFEFVKHAAGSIQC